MDIDKETVKVLAAETRIDILKQLTKRRYMPSELARIFKLAPSTIVEHLKKLEEVHLVEKKETGHKWIYYELTEKGRNIVQPSMPMRFVFSALGGVAVSAFGAYQYVQQNLVSPVRTQMQLVAENTDVASPAAQSQPLTQELFFVPDLTLIAFMIIGVVLLVGSVYKMSAEKKKKK